MRHEIITAVFFEGIYRKNADPWNFEGSSYEQERYARILESADGRRHSRAFEAGCSIGILTQKLARFCDQLEAIDISPTAVAHAKQRCKDLPQVHIECGSLSEVIFSGKFDLIVFSEIGYYFAEEQLQDIVCRLAQNLNPGGYFIAAHWLGTSADHILSGDEVHRSIRNCGLLLLNNEMRYPSFPSRPDGAEMMRPWHICVLIPARNEEELLPRCLHSVLDACTNLPPEITWDIVVAVDASTDGTLDIAEELLAGKGEVVVTQAGIVGCARSAAAQSALSRYVGMLPLCWLAHTDADCIVPEDWLMAQLLLAEDGIEAVAGIISVDSFREHNPEVEERFHSSYLIDTDGRHLHVHGANLGIRADVYCRAGGWAHLATAEDHDMWNRLRVAGCSQLSTAAIQVTTSGRRIGRAPHGFAEALAGHNEAFE